MRWRRPLTLTGLILAGFTSPVHAQAAWTGTWTGAFGAAGAHGATAAGTATVPAVTLRIVENGGRWTAALDLPAYGVFDIGADADVRGDTLRLTVPGLDATFTGTRSAPSRRGPFGLLRRNESGTHSRLAGVWMQGRGAAPLTLVHASVDGRLVRPQEPRGARPYLEEQVRFASVDGTAALAGTLSLPLLPPGEAAPAVVLISGSGPHDRDGSAAGHRPFLVLADHLTRAGFAVLRFDERGVGESTGDFSRATSLDFADDVLAAIRVLASHPRVDASHIGLIGHSEGGMVAPIVANRTADVAFLVLLAAPGLPLAEISVQQSGAILQAEGRPAHEVAASMRTAERLVQLVRSTTDDAAIAAGARTILDESLAPLGLPRALHERQLALGVARFTSPWMRFAALHDPRAELARLPDIPVLALNGSADAQVAAGANIAAIRDALATAGNRRSATAVLPGLNHHFQTARTGAPSEYGVITETFAPAALELITRWIQQAIAQDR